MDILPPEVHSKSMKKIEAFGHFAMTKSTVKCIMNRLPACGGTGDVMDKYKVLKKFFGYTSFHPGQEEMIDSLSNGRDVLAVMPTGAGKSLCYQIPAILSDGISLVISPLLSLMKDQVRSLNQAGVPAAYINSSLTEGQIRKALRLAGEGAYRIIYVAPERLVSPNFLSFALNADIRLIAVDEAHCVSQWGQDFRPSYLKIADFIGQFSHRPAVGAFTATATSTVRSDILKLLALKDPKVLVSGFDRPNLFFGVETPRSRDQWILQFLARHRDESGIIYCATRKNTDRLCDFLNAHGCPAARYHAGMSNEERVSSQDDFIFDRKKLITATNAFGMGIDKSNVRFVIHYNMPQSMENYYQEAGRAGRDGDPAECILLYSPQDLIIGRYMIEHRERNEELSDGEFEELRRRDLEKLRRMEKYCTCPGCLRQYILEYFGEKAKATCSGCSHCTLGYAAIDATREAQKAAAAAVELNERCGLKNMAKVLCGTIREEDKKSRFSFLHCWKALDGMEEADVCGLLEALIREDILSRTYRSGYPMIAPGPLAEEILSGKRSFMWRRPADKDSVRTVPVRAEGEGTWSEEDLMALLRGLRLSIAQEKGLPPHIVFSDSALSDMCRKLPLTEREFIDVSGVGFRKAEEYGGRFLQVIRSFCARFAIREIPEETNKGRQRKTYRQDQRLQFMLTPSEASAFVPSAEPCTMAHFAKALSDLKEPREVRKLFGVDVEAKLVSLDVLKKGKKDTGEYAVAGPRAQEFHLAVQEKLSAKGTAYQTVLLSPEAQIMILGLYTIPDDIN